MIEIKDEDLNLINEQEKYCREFFKEIDEIEYINQLKVLNAFNKNNIQASYFLGSTGYGHNDIGKEKISKVFADIFHTEAAFVSPLISCGTEAITKTLFGLLRPKDTMLSISGMPYDTLNQVIFGVDGKNVGSLKDFDINYKQVDLIDGEFDTENIVLGIKKYNPKIVYIQRSRGYSVRNALTISQIESIIKEIRKISNTPIVVDNCYGEFVEDREPTDVGADLVIGSLLKNLGGGIAPTGGYIAGKEKLVDMVLYSMTSPALGFDIGSYELGYKAFFEGLFFAPHVVAEAKKTARLTGLVMEKLGYKTIPDKTKPMSDIVCSIIFNDKTKMTEFIRGIQEASAVDSNSRLEAGEMDGYADKIIMASGSFNQGSSIELSCDGPMREPYVAYLQGSLSYQHGKIALAHAIGKIRN